MQVANRRRKCDEDGIEEGDSEEKDHQIQDDLHRSFRDQEIVLQNLTFIQSLYLAVFHQDLTIYHAVTDIGCRYTFLQSIHHISSRI